VFKSCSSSSSNNSSSSRTTSRPMARGIPVAAATGSSGGSNGIGGGAIHVVPAGSSHGSFTDLPFLINPWVSNQLRKLVSKVGCSMACDYSCSAECLCIVTRAAAE
jgi:hypothetical protein